MGPYSDNTIADKILHGTITHAFLGLDLIDVDDELDVHPTTLKYTTTSTGEKISQMDIVILLEDYKKLF